MSEKALEVGKQKLAELKAQKTAKEEAKIAEAKAEAKGAAPGSSPEKEKTEGRDEAKAQAQQDEKILSQPEDKLDDKQKERRKVLLKVKEKVDSKDKDKVRQDKIDKRMGELTGEIKDLKKSGKDKNGKYEVLKKEMADLVKENEEFAKTIGASPEDKERDNLKKTEETRLSKYVDEDKDKSLKERREMTREELDNWLLEDLTSAQEWLAERSVRRSDDRKRDAYVSKTSKYFSNLFDKQEPYVKKAYEKHPELNTTVREAELIKDGKTKEEVLEIICKENPKFKLSLEIVKEHNDWLAKDDCAELVVKEMEKRLEKEKSTSDKGKKTEEDKKAEDKRINELVDAELDRREKVDEGITSTTHKETVETEGEELSEEAKKVLKKLDGRVTEEQFKARVKKRKEKGMS